MEDIPVSTWNSNPNSGENGMSLEISSGQVNIEKMIRLPSPAEAVEDDLEEGEIDESQRLHLEEVTSFVDAAYQRMKLYSRDSYLISSATASKLQSSASTHHPASSHDESLDGGQTEVEELRNLSDTLESSLKINQALQRRFTSTLMRLETTLEENLKKQAELDEKGKEKEFLIAQEKDTISRQHYFVRPASFCIPYFKDRSGMPAPMNVDAKMRVDQGYFDLYSTRPRTWMTKESLSLAKDVAKEAKVELIKDWTKKKRAFERLLSSHALPDESKNNQEREQIEANIEQCQDHIDFFTQISSEKLEIPNDISIDWDKVAAQTFDGERSAEECKLHWINEVHPHINKKYWEEDEDILIQQAVAKYKSSSKVDWKVIAENLGTKRTAYQVAQRYMSFIKPAMLPAKWNAEDSARLIDTVNMLRVGSFIPWVQVSQHFVGYTKSQVQGRWKIVNPDQSRGPFTQPEDFIMIKGLYKFGLNFGLIAHFMPGRSKFQVKDRFKRGILAGLTFLPWTYREDKKLMEKVSLMGQHWRQISVFFPKRDTCELRLRFYILHFWHNFTKQKVTPPPLFPLSMTDKRKEISKFREKIFSHGLDAKLCLNSMNARQPLKAGDDMFETHRRHSLRVRNPDTLKRLVNNEIKSNALRSKSMPKPKKRRNNTKGPSWPDKALTEFFLPGRPEVVEAMYPKGESIYKCFETLCKFLQIKINGQVTESEAENLSQVDLDHGDQEIINHQAVFEDNSLDFHEASPESIPLIPPCSRNTEAFCSLLLHKEKLKEMANKEFLLYQVTDKLLPHLGEKPGTWKSEVQGNTSNHLKSFTDNVVVNIDEKDIDEKKSAKNRMAKQKANIINSEYCKSLGRKLWQDLENSKATMIDSDCQLTEPTENELMELQMGVPMPISRALTGDDDALVAKEDKLLFHRFLSMFFWPSLFTIGKPQAGLLEFSSSTVEEMKSKLDSDDEDEPDEDLSSQKEEKFKASINKMDVEEIQHWIDTFTAQNGKIKKKRRPGKTRNKKRDDDDEEEERTITKATYVRLKRTLIMKNFWAEQREGKIPRKRSRGPSNQATDSHLLSPKSSRLREKFTKKAKTQTDYKIQIGDDENPVDMDES